MKVFVDPHAGRNGSASAVPHRAACSGSIPGRWGEPRDIVPSEEAKGEALRRSYGIRSRPAMQLSFFRRVVSIILRATPASVPLLLLAVWVGGAPAGAQVPSSPTEPDTVEKGAPYVPTPEHVVLRMLRLANVSAEDVVYDLGSGDGRIVILAAQKFGARGVGVEIDSQLVREARRRAERAGVADRVTFRQGNLFDTDLSDATVVTLYLWPDMNNRLRPKLQRELDPGDRVVSHSFDIDGWAPDTTVSMNAATMAGVPKTLFRWSIPESGGSP